MLLTLFLEALLAGALVGLVSSTIYLVLVVAAARRFRGLLSRARPDAGTGPRSLPPVTVLKPVHGAELRLEQCLESFFQQRYPEFELIFGGRHRDDPAWETVKKFELMENEWSIDGGELTPTMKVKRKVVLDKYKDTIEKIYSN